MSTMNISLPESLKDYVDAQVTERSYGTSSEYVRELIRHDRDRQTLKSLLLEGAVSPIEGEMDKAWLDSLRERVRSRAP